MYKQAALYIDAAQYVASRNRGVPKTELSEAFPDVEPRRLTKALENACARKLIHRDFTGLYKAGERTSNHSYLKRSSDDDVDTAKLIASALQSRQPIERAWLNFGINNSPVDAQPSMG